MKKSTLSDDLTLLWCLYRDIMRQEDSFREIRERHMYSTGDIMSQVKGVIETYIIATMDLNKQWFCRVYERMRVHPEFLEAEPVWPGYVFPAEASISLKEAAAYCGWEPSFTFENNDARLESLYRMVDRAHEDLEDLFKTIPNLHLRMLDYILDSYGYSVASYMEKLDDKYNEEIIGWIDEDEEEDESPRE